MATPLTTAQKEFYAENGYLVVEDVFSKAEFSICTGAPRPITS
jgi:hypothetical protein